MQKHSYALRPRKRSAAEVAATSAAVAKGRVVSSIESEVVECYERLNKILMAEFATGEMVTSDSTFWNASKDVRETTSKYVAQAVIDASYSQLLCNEWLVVKLTLTKKGMAQTGYMRHDYSASMSAQEGFVNCSKVVRVVPSLAERKPLLVQRPSGKRVVLLGSVLCYAIQPLPNPPYRPPYTCDSYTIHELVEDLREPGCKLRNWANVVARLKELDRRIDAGEPLYSDDDCTSSGSTSSSDG